MHAAITALSLSLSYKAIVKPIQMDNSLSKTLSKNTQQLFETRFLNCSNLHTHIGKRYIRIELMRCETCIFSDDIFANGLCKWIRMLPWFSVRNVQNFTLMLSQVATACRHFLFTSIWCVSIPRWMCSSTKMFSIPINYINVYSSVQHLTYMNCIYSWNSVYCVHK